MTDEIDAGQERGEVARDGRPKTVQASDSIATPLKALGLDRRRVAEWRMRHTGGDA